MRNKLMVPARKILNIKFGVLFQVYVCVDMFSFLLCLFW